MDFKKHFLTYLQMFQGNLIIIPLVVGIVIRLNVILSSDFPINDGGMFYTMTKELIENNFKLPTFTSYNQLNIPFAYPALGFYVTALISTLLDIDLIELFRFIPLVNTVITIPIFYYIAKTWFRERIRIALISTLVFAIIPQSFNWIIMGGGITRSFGMLFYLLTVAIYLKREKDKTQNIFLTVLFLGLTSLSHLEWGALTSITLLAINLAGKFNVTNIIRIYVYTLIFTSPWWLVVLINHGIGPFLNFLQNGVTINSVNELGVTFLKLTDEPFLTLIGTFSVLGLLYQLVNKDLKLPIIFFFPIILTLRGSTSLTVLPLSLLAGIGINNFYRWLIHERYNNFWAKTAIVFIFAYSFVNSVILTEFKEVFAQFFDSLTKNQREAMVWVKENTRKDSKFMLISNRLGFNWPTDNVAEWFPSISERESIITPQATEWLPNRFFNMRREFLLETKKCYPRGLKCLENLIIEKEKRFDYVYIELNYTEYSTTSLINYQLSIDPGFEQIYKNEEVAIYKQISI